MLDCLICTQFVVFLYHAHYSFGHIDRFLLKIIILLWYLSACYVFTQHACRSKRVSLCGTWGNVLAFEQNVIKLTSRSLSKVNGFLSLYVLKCAAGSPALGRSEPWLHYADVINHKTNIASIRNISFSIGEIYTFSLAIIYFYGQTFVSAC